MIGKRSCLQLILSVVACIVWALPARAQVGRATLTGIVTDSAGAVVPNAQVSVRNANTGLISRETTNQTGSYTAGALPVGVYELTVSLAGFREYVQKGITLSADQVARADVRLEVGAARQSIEVHADVEMLATETATATVNVETQAFTNMPLSFNEGRNMAVFAEKLIAGVVGSRYDTSIQGSPRGSQTILLDGQNNNSSFLSGDFAEQSVSPEAIQEMTVTTGLMSAEVGRAGGGVMQFTLKSGQNQVHGSGLYYLRNEILNSNTWQNNLYLAKNPSDPSRQRAMYRRKDYALSGGGPVYLPRIYDGRNKSFFYATFETFKNTQNGTTGGWYYTVPQADFRAGDFSRILTGKTLGTDALGRQVTEGAIYDPATLRQAGNAWVTDMFPGNSIPAARFDPVAKNMVGILDKYYQPMRDTIANNFLQSGRVRQTIRQGTIKADHYFSPAHRVSGFYNWYAQPRTMSDQGIWSPSDLETGGPLGRYINQSRNGYNVNVSYTWNVGPTLLNNFIFGYNNGKNAYGSVNTGKRIDKVWGLAGLSQNPEIHDAYEPPPYFSFSGNTPGFNPSPWGHQSGGEKEYTTKIFSDTLSWQRGRHLFKFGGEYNSMNQIQRDYSWWGMSMNFDARSTGLPTFSGVGNSFASFLLGAVNSANMPAPLIVRPSRYYGALFAQDSWKVTPTLTVNLGLRCNGNSPIYEENNLQANFNINATDPLSGKLGVTEYMGSGPGHNGRRSPVSGDWKEFGPTFGFAWQFANRAVLRGGYGISYMPEFFGFVGVPFQAPLQGQRNVPADSQGVYKPVFYLANGFPNVPITPPTYSPSWADQRGNNPTRVADYTKAGYSQHANLGVQYQFAKDLVLEADWRYTKGTRLDGQGMVRLNQVRPQDLLRDRYVLEASYNSPEAAVAAGLPYTYPGWSGLGYQALKPYPQLGANNINDFGSPVGFSTYHSANLTITKRMSQGLYAYGVYTFSKAITNVSTVFGDVTSFQDTYNLRLYKSISPDDRTHVIKSALAWEIPAGPGKHLLGNSGPVLKALVGGWTVSAVLGYSSGAPLGTVGSTGQMVGWNGGSLVQDFNTPAGGFNRLFDSSRFDPFNPANSSNRFFDPNAFTAPAPQRLGNAPMKFPQVRMPWGYSEDASLSKSLSLREKVRIELRLEMFNVLNRHSFSGVEMNPRNAAFGNLTGANGSREGQAGLRLEW